MKYCKLILEKISSGVLKEGVVKGVGGKKSFNRHSCRNIYFFCLALQVGLEPTTP